MRILLISVIDDPFDPPGSGRFGGGHYLVLDLARHLVRQGDEVTVVTRLNRAGKPLFQDVSSAMRLYRLDVGPPEEMGSEPVGAHLGDLAQATLDRLSGQAFDAIHTQYWVSGMVGLAWQAMHGGVHVHVPISYGRRPRTEGGAASAAAATRDAAEVALFSAVDWLVVASPAERDALHSLYPEVAIKNVALVPCGVDTTVFHPRPGSADHYLRRQAGSLGQGA